MKKAFCLRTAPLMAPGLARPRAPLDIRRGQCLSSEAAFLSVFVPQLDGFCQISPSDYLLVVLMRGREHRAPPLPALVKSPEKVSGRAARLFVLESHFALLLITLFCIYNISSRRGFQGKSWQSYRKWSAGRRPAAIPGPQTAFKAKLFSCPERKICIARCLEISSKAATLSARGRLRERSRAPKIPQDWGANFS
jgi:hypothetical protein